MEHGARAALPCAARVHPLTSPPLSKYRIPRPPTRRHTAHWHSTTDEDGGPVAEGRVDLPPVWRTDTPDGRRAEHWSRFRRRLTCTVVLALAVHAAPS